MAKISPVSIKYMIHANFIAQGALEKPDIIGAIFGQTEGLLGSDLEMRELQKEGKIGRIEVELERSGNKTTGKIQIPTALDQSETSLIAAAIETIEKIGPCDSQIDVERIEDVRGTKRDYIIERAKKLMKEVRGSTDSREISNTIKQSVKISGLQEYGDEKLPCGDISDKEIIVVEGRADVLNLLRNNVHNVIAMNGTKLPKTIEELSYDKEITLFVDGDRGGKLIVKNAIDNADVKYVAIAPDGKEVEELTGKEILMALRKKIPANEVIGGVKRWIKQESIYPSEEKESISKDKEEKLRGFSENIKGSGKALILDEELNEIKKVSAKGLVGCLKKLSEREKPFAVIIDGTVTSPIISAAEDAGCKIIVAKNFATTDTKMQLLSL